MILLTRGHSYLVCRYERVVVLVWERRPTANEAIAAMDQVAKALEGPQPCLAFMPVVGGELKSHSREVRGLIGERFMKWRRRLRGIAIVSESRGWVSVKQRVSLKIFRLVFGLFLPFNTFSTPGEAIMWLEQRLPGARFDRRIFSIELADLRSPRTLSGEARRRQLRKP